MNPLILVDGYNIIGAWPKLIKLRDRGDLEGARERLVHDLTDFGHYRGWQVSLVFDAYGQNTGLTKIEAPGAVEVYYTAVFQTADSFIEQRTQELIRSGFTALWVATSDRAQRILVESIGARVFTAERLIQEMVRARREQQQHQTSDYSRKGRMLTDRLNAQSRARLLRHQGGLS